MLLSTHIATALVLAYVFDFYMQQQYVSYASNIIMRIIIYAVAPIIQLLVDAGGHEVGVYRRRAYYVRTPRTHSIPAVVGIGLALGIPLAMITGIKYMPHYFVSLLFLHWLEDLVTEGGVYIVWHRVRLATISYRSSILNRLTIAFVLALAVIYTKPFTDVVTFTFFIIVVAYSSYAFLNI